MEDSSNLLAILGPTNTGKTYLAFERLVSYKSGIFGFPLRLLARENYDKAVSQIGYDKVALITGEEKIIPKNACYYFSTVESMPLNLEVECIAIDEIQLAADYERGHIFTDRMLHMRGAYETIFLGSQTIQHILLKLFPKINIQKRDRFSKLSFLSKKTLSKLNPRSAIIAFNINSVYEIAESLRAHKGGAAVVLGSLSPRTRNSQVEIYEDKKVDYLVATDAIGMGLNLNINHISFSALQKFDGRFTRNLMPAELGQIAGRAGRHFNDGTFGYLKNAGTMDPLIIKSIENHEFSNIQKIYWRNSKINFSSVKTVLASFSCFPTNNIFIHKKNAEDENNFRSLSKDSDLLIYLKDSINIILLWDVCRIPDFQKIFNDSYIQLLKNIFLTLIKNSGTLDEKWLENKILRLENYMGGIEELSIKIANIRTWTYISNQSSWIKDSEFWQNKTREIENNLSDELHKCLTNRFVDSSASYFFDSRNSGEKAIIKVDKNKKIKLNGQNYGYINGFDLELNISKTESLFSLNHVKKSIRSMIEEKIKNFFSAPFDALNLGDINMMQLNNNIQIYWGDEPIGRLIKGDSVYTPKAETLSAEFLDSDKKILITQKLQEWINVKIKDTLKPITSPIDNQVSSRARTIIFNVYNNLGSMLVEDYLDIIKNLDEKDKSHISRAGIRIGAKFFFMPNLLKKSPMELNAILWKVFYKTEIQAKFPLPTDGRVSFNNEVEIPDSYWLAIGYKCLNNFVLRIDVFERIFFLARKKIKYGPFMESADMMNPVGCNSYQLKSILAFCGFESLELLDNKKLYFVSQKIKKKIPNKIKKTRDKKVKLIQIKNKKADILIPTKKQNTKSNNLNKADPNSPFAVLEKLL